MAAQLLLAPHPTHPPSVRLLPTAVVEGGCAARQRSLLDQAEPAQKRRDLYFWTNFLFVNNPYPYDNTESDQCFVSWYLANDMQFYALSPALILAFLRKRLGIAITLVAVIASCLYTYKWTLETGASAHSFDG